MKKITNIIANSLAILGLIVVAVAINSSPLIFLQSFNNAEPLIQWSVVAAYLLVVAIVITLLWTWYQKGVSEEIKQQKFTLKDLGFVLLYYLAGRVVAVGGTFLNQLYTGNQTSMNDQAIFGSAESFKGGFAPFVLLFLLAISVFAPMIEELVFRGLPIQLFSLKGKKVVAGLVTSLLFALPHATNFVELILYFCLGYVIFLAYARRGNIKDSILLHMLNNLPAAIYLAYLTFS